MERNVRNEYRIYKRRFIIYGIACLHMFFFYVGNYQYTSISTLVTKYYNVGYLAANFTGLFVAITKIALFYPIGRCVDQFGIQFSLVLCGALNAFAYSLKTMAVHRSWFWLLLVAQIFQSSSYLFPISAIPLLGVNWFPVNEMALVTGGLKSIAAFAGLFTFAMPSTVFRNVRTIQEMYIGFGEVNLSLLGGSFLLLLVTIFVSMDKPPTPPSVAGITYNKFSDKEAPLKFILKNRNAVLLVIYHAIYMSVFMSFIITLDQAITASFPDDGGSMDVTIGGILLNGFGIIGSIIVGAVIRKYPKYKLMLVVLNIINVAAIVLYGLSLWIVDEIVLYIALSVFGFVSWSLMSFSLDYLLEVSFPYPSGILLAIDIATGAVPSLVLTPITTVLILKCGSVGGICFLLIVTVLNTVVTLFIGEDFRRRRADQ